MNFKKLPLSVLALLLMLFTVNAAADELRRARPSDHGFSAERLSRLDEAFEELIEGGELAGISTILTRDGEIVHTTIRGFRDLEERTRLRPNSIFRIYSMTKPITGVAMMILYERGLWHPDDRLDQHIPEFRSLRVYSGDDADGNPIMVEPEHAPTVGELMTHTAGFTYGFFGDSPVDRLYQANNPLAAADLQGFIDRLAELPLAYQPGSEWRYSVSVDIQGYLIEKLSGKSLPEFMRDEIFDPLDMADTGFAVAENDIDRLATVYSNSPDGLVAQAHDPNVAQMPGLPSGGGGLYSTARDYARFAQMLANEGALDDERILAPATVRLMRSNHLSDNLLRGGFGIGFQQMRPGFGFGYDVAVFTDPIRVGSTTGAGTYLWDGAAGTWFWIDPANDIVFVGMIQRMMSSGGMPNVQNLSRALVHQALIEP